MLKFVRKVTKIPSNGRLASGSSFISYIWYIIWHQNWLCTIIFLHLEWQITVTLVYNKIFSERCQLVLLMFESLSSKNDIKFALSHQLFEIWVIPTFIIFLTFSWQKVKQSSLFDSRKNMFVLKTSSITISNAVWMLKVF